MESNGGQSVDARAVNAALDAKGIPVDCPICGAVEGWGITDRYALVPAAEQPRSLDGAFEAVCMVCLNCGFVRLHQVSTLFSD